MAQRASAIPRGVEVLVKKASVDAEFKRLLLERRAESAREIGLELEPAEAAMLNGIPASLLEGIIARTTVSPISRAAFLGKAAAVMLAALGADLAIAEGPPPPGGIAPDIPKPTGITPDRPPGRERYILCALTNYKGEVVVAILEDDAYAARLAETAKTNRVLRQAYVAAGRAWAADESRRGVPFPLKAPQPCQCSRMAAFIKREEAEEALARRQEDLDRQAEAAKQAEERRLAALSEEARAAEVQKAKLREAAEAIFERELHRLVAAPEVPKPEPVTRGSRPDRPPASFGIQP